MREFTQAEADAHNALTEKGWSFAQSHMVTNRSPLGPPGWFGRWRLRRAIRSFERALEINPEGWSSMWALGKIHQRLGDRKSAFDWFVRAHSINPTQPDVAREAGLAAMDSGLVDAAVDLCRAAVANSPRDAGLVSNLALALCMAGQDADAEAQAREAVRRNSDDEISATVLRFVQDVKTGTRSRPKRMCDAFPYK